MITIPIADIPSQILTVTLGGQQCRLRVFTRQSAVFMDVYVADVLIVAGALCKCGVQIVRDTYLGFIGDLLFIDGQGANDPSSPGLGTRYQLLYASPSNLVVS